MPVRSCSMYRLQICIDCMLCLAPQASASYSVSGVPCLCLVSWADKGCDKSAQEWAVMGLPHMGIFNANIKYGMSVVLSSRVQEMAGFYNTLSPYFLHFPISAQPLPAEKLTVLLIFDTAMARTKKEKKKREGEVLCMGWWTSTLSSLGNMWRCKTFG